jgi:hypothetical protein
MNHKSIFSLLICSALINQVASQSSFDGIDQRLEQKLANSIPSYNEEIFNRVMKPPGANGWKFYADTKRELLSTIKD